MPSDDELSLVKLEKRFNAAQAAALAADEQVTRALEGLAKAMERQAAARAKLLSAWTSKLSLMEQLAFDPTSRVNKSQLTIEKRRVAEFEAALGALREVQAGLVSLVAAHGSFLSAKGATVEAREVEIRTWERFAKAVFRMRKMSNRLQDDEKFRQAEEEVRQLDQELDRATATAVAATNGLGEEIRALDEAWERFAGAIRPHAA
ncbi:MAG: hypothetical protein Kow0069_09100 [Promethearchaeota archaeon]